MRFGYLGALILGLLVSEARGAERPIRVVTTFLPAYCLAANVAGTSATVENLLPGAVNLHDYQLAPADLRKLANADLIVINGLGLETFLDKALANSAPGTDKKIIRLSDGLKEQLLPENEPLHPREAGHHHSHNPHIWLDPNLAAHGVTNILRALEKLDPPNAAAYRENAEQFLDRLRALDSELSQTLGPLRSVPFVTYHNAFPYFVRHYGLTLIGVVEQVSEAPPSPREISRLLQNIREKQGQALLTEPGGRTRLAEQLARDAHIALAELDPIETGVLDPRSYELAMRRNAASLKKVLAR